MMSVRYRLLQMIVWCVLAGVPVVAPLASALAQPAELVQVDTVKEEPLRQTVPVIGRLVSLRSGNIAARIAGPVEEITVEVGDRVRKGQVIAILDQQIVAVGPSIADLHRAMAKDYPQRVPLIFEVPSRQEFECLL